MRLLRSAVVSVVCFVAAQVSGSLFTLKLEKCLLNECVCVWAVYKCRREGLVHHTRLELIRADRPKINRQGGRATQTAARLVHHSHLAGRQGPGAQRAQPGIPLPPERAPRPAAAPVKTQQHPTRSIWRETEKEAAMPPAEETTNVSLLQSNKKKIWLCDEICDFCLLMFWVRLRRHRWDVCRGLKSVTSVWISRLSLLSGGSGCVKCVLLLRYRCSSSDAVAVARRVWRHLWNLSNHAHTQHIVTHTFPFAQPDFRKQRLRGRERKLSVCSYMSISFNSLHWL